MKIDEAAMRVAREIAPHAHTTWHLSMAEEVGRQMAEGGVAFETTAAKYTLSDDRLSVRRYGATS